MKVRVTRGPRVGRILDWPERQARALIAADRAEPLEEPQKGTPAEPAAAVKKPAKKKPKGGA